MSRIIGTYLYPSYANRGKVEKINSVLIEYRKTAKQIAKLQWKHFFKGGEFSKYLDVREVKSRLSKRYIQTCQWHVVDILESYLGNAKNEFEKIVYKSTLGEKTKRVLLVINRQNKWFDKTIDKVYWIQNKKQAVEYLVSEEEKLIARKIIKYVLKKLRRPRFNNINLNLDSKVAILEENRSSKTFDKWLKISTLQKGEPIYIPLKNNPYAESVEGKFLNFYQIQVQKDKLIVKLIKQIKSKDYRPLTKYLAIDLGLNPLIATDKGDLIGRRFLDFSLSMDEKITKRMKYIQKKGIKPSQDKKYKRMIGKLRSFLKNEVNRYINNLVELYKPEVIVLERLDFRNQNLSKRMNRLVSNFGKRVIKEKIKRLKEIYGIEIVEVNPAYSSQTCCKCGYIDKRNRKDTQTFICRACGYKANAQVNGARNILNRRSIEGVKVHTPKKVVLKILVKQYLERFKGCNSAPLEVLKDNPYFRDYLEDFLNPWSVEKCL
ncbi:MAG: RNA-guided endonuclease TnpB family protein [Thermoproteota archaeon]